MEPNSPRATLCIGLRNRTGTGIKLLNSAINVFCGYA
jgi:hypothetical protein